MTGNYHYYARGHLHKAANLSNEPKRGPMSIPPIAGHLTTRLISRQLHENIMQHIELGRAQPCYGIPAGRAVECVVQTTALVGADSTVTKSALNSYHKSRKTCMSVKACGLA